MRDTVDRVQHQPPVVIGRIGLNLATAAALLLLVLGAWQFGRPMASEKMYSEAELDRIERDLQRVMLVLGQAVNTAERHAVNDVLIGETSPVMRNIPLKKN